MAEPKQKNAAKSATPAIAAESNKPQTGNAKESGSKPTGSSVKSTERRYSLHSAKKPQVGGMKKPRISAEDAPFIRAENEDDDGYDPYSDRRPHAEPLFERDPWD